MTRTAPTSYHRAVRSTSTKSAAGSPLRESARDLRRGLLGTGEENLDTRAPSSTRTSPTSLRRSPRGSRRRSLRLATGLLLALDLSGCIRRVELPPELHDAASCPSFASPEVSGTITDGRLDELSGVVLSRRQPGVLWVHNDSGAGPTLYALGSAGDLLAEVEVSGAAAIDWEDIALGPGPAEGVDYLYVGDIGDNRRGRSSVTIYRLAEPDVRSGSGKLTLSAEPLVLHYEKRPANAEALLVDPRDGAIYVITKDAGAAALYAEEDGVLRYVQPIDAGAEALVTAADISPDGERIALRTYNRGYLWRRDAEESLASALARPPCPIDVAAEPQGEAIAFDPGATRLITVSESREHGGGGVPIHSLPFVLPGP